MIRIFGGDVAASKPAKPDSAGENVGWFGLRAGLTLPTTIKCWWMNMIQDELLSALAACGITPNEAADDQLGACFNTKANRAGDTFTGPVNFNGNITGNANATFGHMQCSQGGGTFTRAATFNAATTFAAAQADNVKFSDNVEFKRTIHAYAGQRLAGSPEIHDFHGSVHLLASGDKWLIPIPGYDATDIILDQVDVAFMQTVDAGITVTGTCELYKRPMASSTIENTPTPVDTGNFSIPQNETENQAHVVSLAALAEPMKGAPFIFPAPPRAYYLVVALTSTPGSILHLYGVTLTYKRARVLV